MKVYAKLDPEFDELILSFETNTCIVKYIYFQNSIDLRHKIELDTFECKNHQKGEGRKLLYVSLEILKHNYPNIKYITLTAVPKFEINIDRRNEIDIQQLIQFKQNKLNNYYTSLGFQNIPGSNEFKGNINDVMSHILNMKGGKNDKKKSTDKKKFS